MLVVRKMLEQIGQCLEELLAMIRTVEMNRIRRGDAQGVDHGIGEIPLLSRTQGIGQLIFVHVEMQARGL